MHSSHGLWTTLPVDNFGGTTAVWLKNLLFLQVRYLCGEQTIYPQPGDSTVDKFFA